MANNKEPIAKKCRSLDISPAVMGYGNKKSTRNPGGNKRKKVSEYGTQLKEKQKVKFVYGVLEKQFQGDGATPEGRYHVTDRRGQGQTQFYRALALDYPNVEDRRRFQLAKRSGKIPSSKGIGGQIEIHGADNEQLAQTLGCIMLDNPNMAALYERVPVGTPVTIVGALTKKNAVASTLAQLDRGKEEI